MMKHGIAAATALLLAGCAAGPNFRAPEGPKAASLTLKAAEPAADRADQRLVAGDVPADWWRLFNSPQLDALVKEALAANPDVAAAEAALRKAHEQAMAERGGLLPTLAARGSAGRSHTPVVSQGPIGTYGLVNASVGISYDPDIFGGVRRTIEARRAQEAAQRFQLEATRMALAANVATTAIREAALRDQIDATQTMIDAQARIERTIQARVQAGEIQPSDLAAQQTRVAETRASLPPLRLALSRTRSQMAIYLGRTPSEADWQAFHLDGLTLPAELPVSLPSELVAQRADVQAAEARLHAANAQIGVASADLLPRLMLSANYGTSSGNFAQLFSPGSAAWMLASSVTQVIFDGGRRIHTKRAAQAGFDEAAASYRRVALGAFKDVSDALAAVGDDADAYDGLSIATRAAENSLKIARAQNLNGQTTYPAVLEAQTTLLRLRLDLVQARSARLADSVALFQALGGGWWNQP